MRPAPSKTFLMLTFSSVFIFFAPFSDAASTAPCFLKLVKFSATLCKTGPCRDSFVDLALKACRSQQSLEFIKRICCDSTDDDDFKEPTYTLYF